MGFWDTMALATIIVVPAIFFAFVIQRFFTLKEKQLEVNALATAERAAEYATSNKALEQRVRVLEQIVTDRGVETAGQIEALRNAPRLANASSEGLQ